MEACTPINDFQNPIKDSNLGTRSAYSSFRVLSRETETRRQGKVVPELSYALRREDEWTHVFLTSALVGSDWSASRPCCFTPQGKIPPVSIG
jgi:hypothetical protein